MAVIAIVFSGYFYGAVFSAPVTSSWIGKTVAVLGIWVLTLVNCLGFKTGPKAANGFLVLKVFALYSIIIVGVATISRGKAAAMNAEGFSWFHMERTSHNREKWLQIWLGE